MEAPIVALLCNEVVGALLHGTCACFPIAVSFRLCDQQVLEDVGLGLGKAHAHPAAKSCCLVSPKSTTRSIVLPWLLHVSGVIQVDKTSFLLLSVSDLEWRRSSQKHPQNTKNILRACCGVALRSCALMLVALQKA